MRFHACAASGRLNGELRVRAKPVWRHRQLVIGYFTVASHTPDSSVLLAASEAHACVARPATPPRPREVAGDASAALLPRLTLAATQIRGESVKRAIDARRRCPERPRSAYARRIIRRNGAAARRTSKCLAPQEIDTAHSTQLAHSIRSSHGGDQGARRRPPALVRPAADAAARPYTTTGR